MKDLDTKRRLCAGALAGITSVTITYPLDLVRTRLSIQTSSIIKDNSSRAQKGIWSSIKHIYTYEGGILALYRGIFPTILGVAPYVGINFAVYEQLREVVTPEGALNPSVGGKLLSGAISGAVAQTLT
jgi:solute carrier family 25 phosphate transporter 23/24/25/41